MRRGSTARVALAGALAITSLSVVALTYPVPANAQRRSQDSSDPAALAQKAVDLSRAGRHAEAEQLYKRALAIFEKRRGPSDPLVAFLHNNLGVLYEKSGRYAEAETAHRRALAIREQVPGTAQADVAESLNNLV
jgi:tetratricopeptide (TPR) repeat protein